MKADGPSDDAIREGEPPVRLTASAPPDSSPDGSRARWGLIFSVAGLALSAVILLGVISEAAFPLVESNGVPSGAFWVCPIWLLAAVASLMGVVTGFAAFGQVSAKESSAARGKAWSAVVLGLVLLAAMVALVIYFNHQGRGVAQPNLFMVSKSRVRTADGAEFLRVKNNSLRA